MFRPSVAMCGAIPRSRKCFTNPLLSAKEFADGGGLLSYGFSYADLMRRSAGYLDKILKGAKPSDLPIGQPIKFELVVNLKTANTLGIAIPDSILLRADEVIR